MKITWMESRVGTLLLGADERGLCLVEFARPQRRLPEGAVEGSHPYLDQARNELEEYFEGRRTKFTVPLVFEGTPFQVRVWKALCTIPYGSTWSYEELARAVGSPRACRAVGMANGQNRMAIVIPCHRVINKGGKLGGYGGGLERKQYLLELEGAWQPVPTLDSGSRRAITSVHS